MKIDLSELRKAIVSGKIKYTNYRHKKCTTLCRAVYHCGHEVY